MNWLREPFKGSNPFRCYLPFRDFALGGSLGAAYLGRNRHRASPVVMSRQGRVFRSISSGKTVGAVRYCGGVWPGFTLISLRFSYHVSACHFAVTRSRGILLPGICRFFCLVQSRASGLTVAPSGALNCECCFSLSLQLYRTIRYVSHRMTTIIFPRDYSCWHLKCSLHHLSSIRQIQFFGFLTLNCYEKA